MILEISLIKIRVPNLWLYKITGSFGTLSLTLENVDSTLTIFPLTNLKEAIMLAYLIMKTSRNLKCKLDRELKNLNITSSQFSVMNQIEVMGNKSVAHEIADTLGYDRPTISAIVQRLYKAEIIVKTDNPKDRRTQYLSLSKDGIKILNQLRHIADDISNDIFKHIDNDVMDTLIEALNQINIELEA